MEKLIFITVTCFFMLSFVMHKERVYNPEFEANIPSVGKQIAEARLQKGYSQAELAQILQVSLNNLQSVERGKAVPVRALLNKIQKILDCEIVMDAPYSPVDLAMKH